MAKEKKSPKEASELFHAIMKASVSNIPLTKDKPKAKKKAKK